MFRIPNSLSTGFATLGLSLAIALSASAAPPQVGFVRTDVKIEAKDIDKATAEGTASPIASPYPLTLESLTSAHEVEIHPHVTTPDTADTHTLRVESR